MLPCTCSQLFELKLHCPIFQNSVSVLYDETSLQRYKFKISVEMIKSLGRTNQFCILQLPISYCYSLIMVTINRDIFINIFQTKHSCEIWHGIWENMSFQVIPISPKVWKKNGKSHWAPVIESDYVICHFSTGTWCRHIRCRCQPCTHAGT